MMKVFDPFVPRTVKDKANRTEKKLAREMKAKRQPCSGAMAGAKGDIVTHDFTFDSKETDGDSFRLTQSDLMKITREAYGQGRNPALIVTIKRQMECPNRWVVLPFDIFEEMRNGR